MFKRAIQLDSSYALPYTALADLYHSYYIFGGNTIKKSEYFRLINKYLNKAFQLDSILAYNYLVKGRIHVIDNNIDEEFKNLRKAVHLNSNVGWFNVGYGWFFFRRGLYPQAIPYMSRAIELDPLVSSFYLARGFSYHFMGNFEEAENDYQKALELEPNHVDVMERYVDYLIDMRRLDEAATQLIHLESIKTNKFLRAKFYAAKGEREKALDLIAPKTNLQIFSLLGMREEAISFLQNTLDRDQRLDQSYYWLYSTNPVYKKVRNDPQFQTFLLEHKKIYEKNVAKYRDR
jgi:tetratricopeptide (TPR) repeat protein